MQSIGLAGIPYAADVRVGHLARKPNFAQQQRQALWITLQRARQELERHGLTELDVVGAVDLTHPAATEGSHEAVTVTKDGPRQKPVLAAASRLQRDRRTRRIFQGDRGAARLTDTSIVAYRS